MRIVRANGRLMRKWVHKNKRITEQGSNADLTPDF